MLRALKKLLPLSERPPEAADAYIALLNAARNPFFFSTLGVPDTIDGRFEVIALHMCLLQQRLQHIEGAAGFAQSISEEFFADMDRALRELGVMDTGLTKRIKHMGKSYHGRLQAYGQALDQPEPLKAALARNLYGTVKEGDVKLLDQAAKFVTESMAQLTATADDMIISGHYQWPDAASLLGK